MRVTYIGPDSDGVTLAPSHGGTFFPQGVPVDVPEALGRSLLEQATFVADEPKTKGTRHGKSTTTGDDPERGQEEADRDRDHPEG